MKSTDNKTPENSDDLFESLFADAASRKKAPGSDEDRIREQLHAQWQGMTARRRKRRIGGLAVAASVALMAVVSAYIFNQPAEPMMPATLAMVDKMDGRVTAGMADGPVRALQRNDELRTGSLLTTDYNARLAITWEGGESIRLDENSRLRLISSNEVELINGRIYVDTHTTGPAGPGSGSLFINTVFGRVSHIGTQYMTSLTHDQVAVSVRQGSVLVLENDQESIAKPGEQLSISDKGVVRRSNIASYGENWHWVEEISPDFVLDGRSLADFLDWVANESGHDLEYSSAVAESLATDTLMHGVVNLEPMRALTLMLQTSDLVASVEKGRITVDMQ